MSNPIQHELVERISRLDTEKQQQVLEFVRRIEEKAVTRTYSARELMKLPFEERNHILHEQLQQAAGEDFETFEAYSEEIKKISPAIVTNVL